MSNEYVKLWISYEAYFEPLGAAEVGRLALAMMKYKSQGVEPVFSGNERFVWPAIRRDIDEQNEAQKALSICRSEAGKRGGRPKDSEAIAFQQKQKKQMLFAESKKSHGQGQGHNKEIDISDDISIKKFGEFKNVILTGDDYTKLVDSLGEEKALDYIERLSAYLAQTGRRYKSHYATILNWSRKDKKETGQPDTKAEVSKSFKPKSIEDAVNEMEWDE